MRESHNIELSHLKKEGRKSILVDGDQRPFIVAVVIKACNTDEMELYSGLSVVILFVILPSLHLNLVVVAILQ